MITPEEIIGIATDEAKQKRLKVWQQQMAPLVESPIEALFLAAVFASNVDWGDNPTHIYTGEYKADESRFEGDHLWPQVKIGQYRVDFLLEHVGRTSRRVIVECDGHEFHDKDKVRAAADKARDRFLVSLGYQVLRFTGSEICQDPFRCWAETRNVLWGAREAA